MTALQKLIAQKRQAFEEEQQKQENEELYWKEKVDELYQQVTAWLKPLLDDGSVTIDRFPAYGTGHFEPSRLEGDEGNERMYEVTVKGLIIQFFNGAKIEFSPVGLNIVGGYGRVDLALGPRKIVIVMKEKDGEWFFTERYGLAKSPLYKFTQTDFEQLVSEFVEKF